MGVVTRPRRAVFLPIRGVATPSRKSMSAIKLARKRERKRESKGERRKRVEDETKRTNRAELVLENIPSARGCRKNDSEIRDRSKGQVARGTTSG